MPSALHVHDVAEVGVEGHQDPPLAEGPSQESGVAWVGAEFACLDDVVSFLAEPLRQAPAGAAVDQKLQPPATRTASKRSLAIAARAYSRQARMSSGSRSG